MDHFGCINGAIIMKSLQPHQKHNCFSCVWEDLLLIPSFLFLFPDDCEPIKFLFARQCEHARGWFRCLLTRYLFISLRSGCTLSCQLMASKWVYTLVLRSPSHSSLFSLQSITESQRSLTRGQREIVCFHRHHCAVSSVSSGAQLRRADVSMN